MCWKIKGYNIIKDFPPIRVWGTIGFIAAMWVVDHFWLESKQYAVFLVQCTALVLGIYAFTMPKCAPVRSNKQKSLITLLGLDALFCLSSGKC